MDIFATSFEEAERIADEISSSLGIELYVVGKLIEVIE